MTLLRSSTLSACAFLLAAELVFQFDQGARAFALDTPTATYRLTFDATWSAETHPIDFPTLASHFSNLIGGTHTGSVTFWSVGELASPAIEAMAERGQPELLRADVETQISLGLAGQVIYGPVLAPCPGSLSITFTVTQEFPLATIVSMFGPSPDWFIGINGLSLFQNDQWVSELVVPLFPYDAGTDNGLTYGSPDDETIPPEPIREKTGLPFYSGGPVVPVGTFTFRRVDGGVPAVSVWGYAVMTLLLLTAGSVALMRQIARRGAGRTNGNA